jgi:hypothetical protein
MSPKRTAGDTTMRAVIHYEYGGPEVFLLVETERPVPGPGQVLVRVKATRPAPGPGPEGTVVEVGLGIAGTWHLIRSGDRWSLESGCADEPAARIDLPAAVAWRQFTGLA